MRVAEEELRLWLDHGAGPGGARSYLRKVQARLNWVPREAISLASEHYQVSYASLMEDLSFNPGFSLEPRGERVLEICQGLACREVGSHELLRRMEASTGLRQGQTAGDGSCSLLAGPCQGRCAIGANARLNGEARWGLGPDSAGELGAWLRPTQV
ncbi:MAG TPA: NAD(P)H-dependent oxidoreductase subunit E [bacterium]|jgi:NADH:ubiquinone oxidoreductase subunit E|nr:NAD(P)H-dependent oxidoreductase subunit E [bacterium]